MIFTQTYVSEIDSICGYSVKPFELLSGSRVHNRAAFFGQTTDDKYFIKMANPILASNIDLLNNEIIILREIKNHLSIINLIDNGYFKLQYLTGEEIEVPFMVIDKCEIDLSEMIKAYRHGMPYNHWVKIIKDITDATCFLHDNKIAHCDIRMDNILINYNAGVIEAKLCDFGYALIIEEETSKKKELTVLNEFSPPDTTLSFAFDIYSLGVLLYKLTNKYSFFQKSYRVNDVFSFLPSVPLTIRPKIVEIIKEATIVDNNLRKLTAHDFSKKISEIFGI
jgi:serine/threonine protein kinase